MHFPKKTGEDGVRKDAVLSAVGKGLYGELIGDRMLTLEGYGKITEYSGRGVELLLKKKSRARMRIEGEELCVTVIRAGVLCLRGKITGILFLDGNGGKAGETGEQ